VNIQTAAFLVGSRSRSICRGDICRALLCRPLHIAEQSHGDFAACVVASGSGVLDHRAPDIVTLMVNGNTRVAR